MGILEDADPFFDPVQEAPEDVFESLPLSEVSKTIDILTASGEDPQLLTKVTSVYRRRGGRTWQH